MQTGPLWSLLPLPLFPPRLLQHRHIVGTSSCPSPWFFGWCPRNRCHRVSTWLCLSQAPLGRLQEQPQPASLWTWPWLPHLHIFLSSLSQALPWPVFLCPLDSPLQSRSSPPSALPEHSQQTPSPILSFPQRLSVSLASPHRRLVGPLHSPWAPGNLCPRLALPSTWRSASWSESQCSCLHSSSWARSP